MKAGKMRHRVNVMRPHPPEGESAPKAPTELRLNVPCSIETLRGMEGERLKQVYATATVKVEMYGDPKKPLHAADWLKCGDRQLNIIEIRDKMQNGIELELICGEEVK